MAAMPPHPHPTFSSLLHGCCRIGLLFLVALAVAACQERQRSSPTPTPTALPLASGVQPGDAQEPEAVNVGAGQLVVWLPAFSGIAADNAAGDVLQTAMFQFQQSHPGLSIDVQVKAESGVAGMWPFLRTAQSVAPSILPDLALINTQHLWQGAELGMVVALSEGHLAPMDDFGDDFYAALPASVRYDTQVLGIPYAADVVHILYADPVLEEALPTWETLLDAAPVYLFPGSAVESAVNLHTMAQYLGAGGQLSEGSVSPDLDAIAAYFDFLAVGRLQGVIPAQAVELATLSAVYTAYHQNPSGLAAVLGSDVLAGGDSAQMRYAPLPTRSGRSVAVVDSWAFAVLTQDSERQALALDLVAALLDPGVQGAWSQFAHRLPSRRSALAEWDHPGPYRQFLEEQLETAAAVPTGRAFADFARRLQAGQVAVLRGDATPDEAVRVLGSGQ